MKSLMKLASAAIFLCAGGAAQAGLAIIGTATYGGNTYNLVWDDDNNGKSVIWLDYTHLSGTEGSVEDNNWDKQMAWAGSLGTELTYSFNAGYTVAWSGSWRLPTSVAGEGYNIIESEMGHLNYEEFGNEPNPRGNYNFGVFQNLVYTNYWSKTEASNPERAYVFGIGEGFQQTVPKLHYAAYGLAIRTAQVQVDESVAPVITGSVSGTVGDNGWYLSDAVVSFTCADEVGGSGIATNTVAGSTLNSDGANQSVTNTGQCSDKAGNTASPVTVTINIDKTAPTASASVSPAPNASGWHNSDVTVSFSGSDALSGIASCSADAILSSEGSGQSSQGTCTDNAGNDATATASGIAIDKTAPVVNVTGVANGATYDLGAVPTASCDTQDALSGVATAATLALTGANPDGTGLITATCGGASDNAGNSAAAVSVSYTVELGDDTAPVITPNVSGTQGNNDWYVSDVTVSFTCADEAGGSGIATDTVAGTTLSSEGGGQSVTNTGECIDNAGNTASPVTVSINIDKTAPTASANVSPAANANGWHNSDVTVSFSGTDAVSGLAGCDPDAILGSEGSGQSASGTCTDNAGNVSAAATASDINIDKTAPVASHDGPFFVDEGSSVVLDGSASSDGLSGISTTGWVIDGNPVADPATFDGVDDAEVNVSLQVTDLAGNTAVASTTITVDNVDPTIVSLTGPVGPVAINAQPITIGVEFGDPGTLDTFDIDWDWGDGNLSMTSATTPGASTNDWTYQAAGVFPVEVTVTDDDSGLDASVFQYVVIYDPDAGFVTGGGWIMSPEGACAFDACLDSTTGKANFGFVSKYKKGATAPVGTTDFHFKAGNLEFNSSNYEWLVVAGARAQYKGTGSINDTGNYGFMITAVDSNLTPSTTEDLFRIKIWDRDNGDTVVYDNQMGDSDEADVSTAIGGGSIVIHVPKGNK